MASRLRWLLAGLFAVLLAEAGQSRGAAGRESRRGAAGGCEGHLESPAVNLCSEDFPRMQSSKMHLIMFYSPTCGHCETMMPILLKVAKQLRADAGVVVGGIDCTKSSNKDTCRDYGITGYPTIHAVGWGHKAQYKGPAGEKQLQNWFEKVRDAHRPTAGGSTRCPAGLFEGAAVVPLCKAHFPGDSSKHPWLVVLYNSRQRPVDKLRQALNAASIDLGNEVPGTEPAPRKQKQRQRLAQLGKKYGLELKLPIQGLSQTVPLAKVGGVCCDCTLERTEDDSLAFCRELRSRGGLPAGKPLPELLWVERGLAEASAHPITAAGLAQAAVRHLGFLSSTKQRRQEEGGSTEL